nr:hypothetical protein [uncultured Porphyromonas sp.]
MNKILFLSLAFLSSVLTSGCQGQKSTETSTSDSTQLATLSLPELAQGDQIIFENNDLRIVERDLSTNDEEMLNSFEVQPKHTGIKGFTIKGSTLDFEAILGNTLVTSEGTGVVRTLWLHDLATGEVVVPVDYPFDSDTLERQGTDALFFYTYDWNKNPRISWDQKKGTWVDQTKVPAALRNKQLKEAQQAVKDFLSEGLPLMAKQKVKVDLKERKVTPLPEYKWGYVE